MNSFLKTEKGLCSQRDAPARVAQVTFEKASKEVS